MSTIKFVVEIDEQYVRDHSDHKKMEEKVKGEDKNAFMKGFLDVIGFTAIEKAINEGTTEFVISRDNIDPKANDIFDHILGSLAVLAGVIAKTDDNE